VRCLVLVLVLWLEVEEVECVRLCWGVRSVVGLLLVLVVFLVIGVVLGSGDLERVR